jgi:hypothetical protein
MVEFCHPPYSPDCASQLFSILKCENGLPRGRFQDIRKTTTELNAVSVDVFSKFCATVRETGKVCYSQKERLL